MGEYNKQHTCDTTCYIRSRDAAGDIAEIKIDKYKFLREMELRGKKVNYYSPYFDLYL